MTIDVFRDVGVEISLKNPDDFLKIKETLQRVGVASRDKMELYQSCHILHKKGKYAIVHFKEMFLLDGRPSNFDETDKARRNTIATMLEEWGLLTILDRKKVEKPIVDRASIKVLRYQDKQDWTLVAKYSIGNKRKLQ